MKLLQNKSCLITGGTRGIGRAIVLEFANEGANVAFTYAGSVDKAAEIQGLASQFGIKCLAIQADATDFNKAQLVVDEAVKEFGTLDVVVNNAGITRDNLLLRMTEEQWDTVQQHNLKSVFNYTKAACKQMMRQKNGVFLNLSSVVGVGGNAGQANYAASKAGIIGFTKSVAKELASRNIRANAIAPGFIITEMTATIPETEVAKWIAGIPLARGGTALEVAQLCAFLASDKATYITGEVIQIDGGMG